MHITRELKTKRSCEFLNALRKLNAADQRYRVVYICLYFVFFAIWRLRDQLAELRVICDHRQVQVWISCSIGLHQFVVLIKGNRSPGVPRRCRGLPRNAVRYGFPRDKLGRNIYTHTYIYTRHVHRVGIARNYITFSAIRVTPALLQPPREPVPTPSMLLMNETFLLLF